MANSAASAGRVRAGKAEMIVCGYSFGQRISTLRRERTPGMLHVRAAEEKTPW